MPRSFQYLVNQYLARIDWKQKHLAELLSVHKSTVNKYVHSGRGRTREVVLTLIECFAQHGALSTVGEANVLLEAAGYCDLREDVPREAELLARLAGHPDRSGVRVEGVENQWVSGP